MGKAGLIDPAFLFLPTRQLAQKKPLKYPHVPG